MRNPRRVTDSSRFPHEPCLERLGTDWVHEGAWVEGRGPSHAPVTLERSTSHATSRDRRPIVALSAMARSDRGDHCRTAASWRITVSDFSGPGHSSRRTPSPPERTKLRRTSATMIASSSCPAIGMKSGTRSKGIAR
jgi:hypothetical protein